MHCSYAMFVAMLVIKHFEQRCYILPYGPSGYFCTVSQSEHQAKNPQNKHTHTAVVVNEFKYRHIQYSNDLKLKGRYSP